MGTKFANRGTNSSLLEQLVIVLCYLSMDYLLQLLHGLPLNNNNVSGVATAINNLGYSYISAGVVSGKLNIYSSQVTTDNPT
jgi:hypothetical protein